MHPRVFEAFESICRQRRAGGDVLEIGAVPSDDSLLTMTCLQGARAKTGVNLAPATRYRDFDILQANAHDLRCFADASFDTVLCNSVLEHDPFFWRSLAEMKRVARRGGLLVIGVPGFTQLPMERLMRWLLSLPILGPMLRAPAAGLLASTLTLQTHRYPEDYYRFSPQAMHDVILEGLHDVAVQTIMVPPRVIGAGIHP